ncbi:right-handed parallel beta-helix repeat-containing protein [Chondromyces crocatus]|uniref:Right handed beta helix domain-containing protein n=1 Tax=Chondromyces crocatus TaxID=52 RepID=A0A0K1E920_CHOCO|nr:right-handed parallel beta-helix repeat-containing protein [Chondromyces crocatus]AKT37354.1 uncharacterized protein CMC5_014890 [Chondromyces crocatus]
MAWNGAKRVSVGLGVGVVLAGQVAGAAEKEIGPGDDLIAEIAALQPGDELVLQGGTYSLNPKLTIAVSGTAQAPIVIRAKAGEVPVITRPNANQNVINIEGSEHVVLRGLEVTGGSHGIRMNQARFITVEDCEIHETDDVALSANFAGSSYEGLILRRNHIHHTNGTGEGMYLGCNNNGCQVWNSVIEGNWIHDTNRASVSQGDGIELKEGSYNNIIRDNVIHDTKYPCILTYSTVGNGAPNVVERNVMWGCGDHGIQAAADAVLRNNVILSAAQDGIRSQVHQSGAPSNLIIAHNTIFKAQGNAVRISGATGSVLIANNALYAQNGAALTVAGDLAQLVVAGNVGVGSLSGTNSGFDGTGELGADFVAGTYGGAPPVDAFPAVGSALIAAGVAAHVVGDDFNGVAREGHADVGAYRFDEGGNPGWTITAGFKDLVGSGGSGGSGDGGSGGTGDGGGGEGGAGQGASGGGGPGGASGGEGGGEDGGCGCRVGGASEGTGGFLLAGLLGMVAARWRRRVARRDRGGIEAG